LNTPAYPSELFHKELGEFMTSRLNSFDYTTIAVNKSVIILGNIQEIIKNPDLSDFEIVEQIVNIFEQNGISTGTCHDF